MPSGVRSWKMPRPLTVVSEMKLVAESMNKYDTIGKGLHGYERQ